MQRKEKENFFTLVPKGATHDVVGERQVMLPGLSLEILTTRKICLTRWNLSELNDPYWRLYCPVSGTATVRFGDSSETILSPGNIYIIPPRTTFSSHNSGPFTKWYVHFILGRSDMISIPGLYAQPMEATAKALLKSLDARGTASSYAWEPACLVVNALSNLPKKAWSDQKLDARVEKAIEFLHANLSKKITAEDAARAAGVSVRNLNHLFRSQLRLAPMSVLLNCRLDMACRLLRHTDFSIEHIAETCGFPNRYYFSRMLKQNREISPAAYRKGQL